MLALYKHSPSPIRYLFGILLVHLGSITVFGEAAITENGALSDEETGTTPAAGE